MKKDMYLYDGHTEVMSITVDFMIEDCFVQSSFQVEMATPGSSHGEGEGAGAQGVNKQSPDEPEM